MMKKCKNRCLKPFQFWYEFHQTKVTAIVPKFLETLTLTFQLFSFFRFRSSKALILVLESTKNKSLFQFLELEKTELQKTEDSY